MVGIKDSWKLWVFFGLAALLVMLPLFRPGFILTLDMVFTPHLDMPAEITSSYLLRALLHALNTVLPAQVIQKVMLYGILVFSGMGAYRLIKKVAGALPIGSGIYPASLFYMVNPYTYSRFMAGQYNVLLGYMLLPWFVKALLDFLQTPEHRRALAVAALATAISIVSIHSLGPALLLGTTAWGLYAYRNRHSLAYRTQLLQSTLLLVVGFVIAGSYWLVPVLLGKGSTSAAIESFSTADVEAFQTTGNHVVVRIINILRLQGFWAENYDLYRLPQTAIRGWGLLMIATLVLVYVGLRYLWRSSRKEMVALLVISLVGTIIIASGLLAPDLLLTFGYREPHKFVMVVAIAYSVGLSFGIDRAIATLRAKRHETLAQLVAYGAFAWPFLITPTMFWGFHNQLIPRQYPDDWAKVNQQLSRDSDNFRAIFLPWHLYTYFDFAGRIIASPAKDYFDKPVLISSDPEFSSTKPLQASAASPETEQAVRPGSDHDELSRRLTQDNIKYVLLAKEYDHADYAYLDTQPDLQLLYEGPSLKVYKNTAWRHP